MPGRRYGGREKARPCDRSCGWVGLCLWYYVAMAAAVGEEEANTDETEIVEIPNRGHALTIDRGWREVADRALAPIRHFV